MNVIKDNKLACPPEYNEAPVCELNHGKRGRQATLTKPPAWLVLQAWPNS
jgi:hypothetical protein